MFDSETIAAISTASGSGAIAIVRLSGPNSWSLVKKIFWQDRNFASQAQLESHRALHGFIQHPATRELVDEVVLIAYRSPNSYTGEDLVEINCHGSPYITREILSICISLGARLARPGEFTQRAFINCKIDLTQAEAVLDLIQSRTGGQSRNALSALSGDIGQQIRAIRTDLIELLSRVVAGIDFPEEVGDLSLYDLTPIVDASLQQLEQLCLTARSGRFLREGLKLAIIGKPNVGKSSLLNRLLHFERAIVTDTPGTTRDSLEELLDLNGIPTILIDTAGIRDTADQVEQIGIERTYRSIEESDLVLLVTDVTTGWNDQDRAIAMAVANRPHILLANKIDLNPDFILNQARAETADTNDGSTEMLGGSRTEAAIESKERLGQDLTSAGRRSPPTHSGYRLATIAISARTGEGIDTIKERIERWVCADKHLRDSGATLNQRQGELCQKAVAALRLVQETVANDMPQDCLATDLKTAIDSLSEICGEAVSEEIISNIFARFCIGK